VQCTFALIFYDLFKVVNRSLAALVAFFTLVGTAVEAVNLLNYFEPLILLDGGHHLSALKADQLQSLAYTSLELQAIGFDVAVVFFAFYDLSIAYILFRSTFLPRILGVLMGITGLCYLTNSFASFLSPGFAAQLIPYILMPSGVWGTIAVPMAPRDRRERTEIAETGRRSGGTVNEG
jgi:hypothetical protein